MIIDFVWNLFNGGFRVGIFPEQDFQLVKSVGGGNSVSYYKSTIPYVGHEKHLIVTCN